MTDKPTKKRGLFGKLFGTENPDADQIENPAPNPVADESQAAPSAIEQGVTNENSDARALPASQAGGEVAELAPQNDDDKDDVPQSAAADTVDDDLRVAEDNADAKSKSWFSRLTSGLTKTSSRLTGGITSIFTQQKLDEDTLDDFEDILIEADLGIETASRIRDQISSGRYDKGVSPDAVKAILAGEVEKVLTPVAVPLKVDTGQKPHVILVVGVNGSGKTTTIGKLAAQFKSSGHEVMIAAGDTFRAAAIDQLKVWGERAGVTVVSRELGSDAAGLAFDALKQAQDEGADVLMIDTAGRLQNKQALMEELEKVIRVVGKLSPGAPHDTLLVLDATTGQNATTQVDAFRSTAGVTGLIMTKLDGTARGGILVAITAKYGLPVHAIGVGEGIDDLQPFDAAEFAAAIAGR